MHFPIRAAAIAATLCASTLVAAGTPGLALMLDKPLPVTPLALKNVPVPAEVPTDPILEAPATADTPAPVAPVERPASLAAAVATQTLPGQVSDDLRCLATAIYYEAKGEPLAGQLGVAHVILNRSESGRFPRTVCGVVTQPGQFAFVHGGQMASPGAANHAYRTALAVAQLALDRQWESPVAHAMYFHATRVAPKWGRQRVATIGRHIFYR